jgi:hypothetical protein
MASIIKMQIKAVLSGNKRENTELLWIETSSREQGKSLQQGRSMNSPGKEKTSDRSREFEANLNPRH